MTRLTLFADASYCAKTKAGGWGAWFKTDGMKEGVLIGGTFKTAMTNSSEAELAALANALTRLCNDGRLVPVAELMVQSDSMRALQLIAHKLPGVIRRKHKDGLHVHDGVLTPSPTEVAALGRIGLIRGEAEMLLVVRHVKGHSPWGGRSWVNRQCDEIAKRHMEMERKRLGGPSKKTRPSKSTRDKLKAKGLTWHGARKPAQKEAS